MLKRSIALLLTIALGLAYASAQNKDRVLVVMTRNLDAGSDFGFVTSATTPLGLIIGVTQTYQEVIQSNIPERAQGIAAEIQAQHPDLVALQEVTTLRVGPFGGPATTVIADQLQSLTAALAARGLHYAAVAIQQNADVEAPAVDQSFNFFDVRLTSCWRAPISPCRSFNWRMFSLSTTPQRWCFPQCLGLRSRSRVDGSPWTLSSAESSTGL